MTNDIDADDKGPVEGSHAVLIVDDEVTFRRSLAEGLSLLSGDKYRPVCVGSVDQALALLKNRQFSALVTDIRMPGKDGLQLLLEMKRQSIRIPTLVTTAYGSPAVHAQAARSGAVRYIEKPFPLEQLLEFLESVTAQTDPRKGRTLDLVEVIEMLCMGHRDMRVGIRTRDIQGAIYTKDGEIVHAESGARTGVEALLDLLALPQPQISTEPGEDPPQTTIAQPWQELTEEAWRRRTLAPPARPRREALPPLEFTVPEEPPVEASAVPDSDLGEGPVETPAAPAEEAPLRFWEGWAPSDVEARLPSVFGLIRKPELAGLDDAERTSILVVIDGAHRLARSLRPGALIGCVVKTVRGTLVHIPIDDLHAFSATCHGPALPERRLYQLARTLRPDYSPGDADRWGARRMSVRREAPSGGDHART